MPMRPGELIVIYDLLPEIAAKIDEVASKVIRKAAFDLQAQAQANAPVDTGFLKNSIYVEMQDTSTYGQAQDPQGDQTLLPEVEKPSNKTTAIVAVGANYGIFVEYGSVHGPPQPYLTPAAEMVKPEFERAMDKILTAMEVSAVT